LKDFEHKDYLNARYCFKGDEVKVASLLDSYAQNQIDLTDVNRVFELYHTKLFFEIVSEIPGWSEEKYNKYKGRTLKLNNVVYEFFKQITEDNIVEIFDSCYVSYWEDFRGFFYKFKTYKCISKHKICDVLKGLRWNTFHILSDKDFVAFFDEEITKLLEEQEYGLKFVVSYYLEEYDKKQIVYIPQSFTVDKRVKLVEDYLNGNDVNPNILQLIIKTKNTSELPITPKMKKCADQRNMEFWKNNKSAVTHKYGFCVSFGAYENVKTARSENGEWFLEYDTGWIKDNIDYPTLLNNFIYLFEYVDSQMRCTYISKGYGRSVFADLFAVRGRGMYKKSTTFDMLESLSDIQMSGYVNELNKLEINIEDIIKWFFESYLLEEFGIKNYTCNMPSPDDSIISKCKTLASAIDGVLNKFKMICDDGEIDLELFRYITDSSRIKDVPSLIKNKYCYVKSEDIQKEMNMLFSSQKMLGYTEKYKSKYETLFSLITNEEIALSDCEPYNLESLKWLLDRNVIYLKNDILKCNLEKAYILRQFFEKDVISLQHFKSEVLKEMLNNGSVVSDNKLLTKSEYQYFDYLLNNAEFSDGKAIRNRYIHDSIVPNEDTMNADYNTLLKVMIILIIKINDDCCIYDEVKKEGDFYEL
jgi:hypothetical protein